MKLRDFFTAVFFFMLIYDMIYYMYFYNQFINIFSNINYQLILPTSVSQIVLSKLSNITLNPLFSGFTIILYPVYFVFQYIINIIMFIASLIVTFFTLTFVPFAILPYPLNILVLVIYYMLLTINIATGLRIMESGLSNDWYNQETEKEQQGICKEKNETES